MVPWWWWWWQIWWKFITGTWQTHVLDIVTFYADNFHCLVSSECTPLIHVSHMGAKVTPQHESWEFLQSTWKTTRVLQDHSDWTLARLSSQCGADHVYHVTRSKEACWVVVNETLWNINIRVHWWFCVDWWWQCCYLLLSVHVKQFHHAYAAERRWHRQ